MSIDEIMRKGGDMQNILKEERSPLAHTIIILSTYPFFNKTIFLILSIRFSGQDQDP